MISYSTHNPLVQNHYSTHVIQVKTDRINASANDIQKDSYGRGQQSEFIWRCHFQTAVSH